MTDSSENIDLSKFTQSLHLLQEQHHNLLHGMDEYPSLVVEGIRESVIQRFEVCMDTCWKTLKRYLTEVLALNDVPSSPPGVFRLGADNSLLGGELVDWLEYVKVRNDTSHDYSKDKADACLAVVGPFVRDALVLHERLAGESWEGSD